MAGPSCRAAVNSGISTHVLGVSDRVVASHLLMHAHVSCCELMSESKITRPERPTWGANKSPAPRGSMRCDTVQQYEAAEQFEFAYAHGAHTHARTMCVRAMIEDQRRARVERMWQVDVTRRREDSG